eukprot:m.2016 g.2016  ORF g.2016 m.2016 type:complete len:246 (-) comp1339_c0_seq1:307-1044(-)
MPSPSSPAREATIHSPFAASKQGKNESMMDETLLKSPMQRMASSDTLLSPSSSAAPSTRVPNSLLGKIQTTMYYQNWSLIVSALSLLTSIVYFYFALGLMRSTSEAQLFDSVLTEYSSPQMLDSLQLLWRFHDLHPNDYSETFLRLYRDKTEEGTQLEHARRRVEAWYSKVIYFHEFDLLHYKYLSVFPGPQKAEFFLRLVQPLSEALCKFHNVELPIVFSSVRKIYGLSSLNVTTPTLQIHDDL